ncbi:hypothetical protein HaLaN_02030 [Haematococcus lacustris]|uniref:Uncharacterized protein n=1 Tax=Haematococcus lacustris TaxID=44745 RepID=A0A699YCW5_HAELA|nr:hypothetical protein HaLaN_02030 [Haematococcus lacustris]
MLCQLNTRDEQRTKAEPAAEPTKGKGKAAKAKPAPQPGRWLDRDCNAALNMQRIGESRWRPLELCWWPQQGALPAKGKEYPGLGYKRLRDNWEQLQHSPTLKWLNLLSVDWALFAKPSYKAGSTLAWLGLRVASVTQPTKSKADRGAEGGNCCTLTSRVFSQTEVAGAGCSRSMVTLPLLELETWWWSRSGV